MALSAKQPTPSRLSPKFNKRLNRNLVLIAVFFATAFLLWSHNRDRKPPPELPPNILWPEPHEVNWTHNFPTTSEFQPVSMDTNHKTVDELCASFPKHMLSRIQPVLKMGYSESRDKINSQLDSVSACFSPDDLIIFSDLEETLRGHKVIDVLAYLPDTYRHGADTTKFQQYILQKEMKENGTLAKDPAAAKKIDGWALDKFKFLPGVERAWAMKPNKEFYVFYETDTYIIWDNMFRFLDALDPDAPIYMGSPSPGRIDGRREQGTLFANGGPGYVLSRGAMKKLLHRRVGPTGAFHDPPATEKFRYLAHDGECCGDSILGFALWESGVVLQGFYPSFTPYLLTTLPFDDDHWCHPLLTMHKVDTKDMVALWKWEFEHRKHGQPIIYSDLWYFYHPGRGPSTRNNWNNNARNSFEPPAEPRADSFEECQKLCSNDEKCLQWLWKGRDRKTCHLMHSIHYGSPQNAHEEEGKWIDYKSGWDTVRIDEWRAGRGCEVVNWVGPSLKRIF
ncbi:hypothetical protein QQS21_000110 [Conoideocrella luteorostrata]|uniref:N-acetylgalactosaminide beta-1,3-galactosyltransferase n=1 Tax=Conoideocrella luteorostrata TaxID=1105319 RepID=A0AAJ0CZM0_9HYPO|nr:hypothetical protein QQS21_000110 [Conoideocrella luteorostrata]